MMLFPNGIDMYHGDNREDAGLSDAQLTQKFVELKQRGIFWIMHKVSQGLYIVDGRYKRRRDCARAAGIKFFGGYHYLTSNDVEGQVENFLKAANDDGEMCFAVDFERSKTSPALHQLRDFISIVQSEVALPKLYGGGYLRDCLKPLQGGHQHQNMIGIEKFFVRCDLWLAEYGPHENIPWPWSDSEAGLYRDGQKTAAGVWAWQFSDRGKISEIVGKLDLNYFAGTDADMATRWRN